MSAGRAHVCAVFFIALLAVSNAANLNDIVLSEEVKASLPVKGDGALWEADHNSKFANMPVSEFKKMLGAKLVDPKEAGMKTVNYEAIAPFLSIPDSFDARQQWPTCVHPILDQAKCGSCWAFSATEALSDRLCIASNGKIDVVLSPQDLVSCDSGDAGCGGGQLNNAWSYLENTGAVTEECMPYSSADGSAAKCSSTCTGSGEYKKYFAQKGSSVALSNEQTMQMSIMTHGPIQSGFYVYKDFPVYKSGIYHKAWYHIVPLGGHAIKMVGWGVEGGVKYWIVANSWGSTWGENGYFRIRRGTDECKMESMSYSGLAQV